LVLKKIFDFYQEQYSRGFVCICTLVRMTHFMFHISADQAMANFAFGTIVGYNFVKYDALARAKKNK
jgi:hypothetical protein